VAIWGTSKKQVRELRLSPISPLFGLSFSCSERQDEGKKCERETNNDAILVLQLGMRFFANQKKNF
jgi:hypothetical protein